MRQIYTRKILGCLRDDYSITDTDNNHYSYKELKLKVKIILKGSSFSTHLEIGTCSLIEKI